MKQYRAKKYTAITQGRVRMGKPQAFVRSGNLRAIPGKPDEYEITNQVILAPGETVWIDTDDPEALGLELVEPKRNPIKAGTVKKATAKAKAKK